MDMYQWSFLVMKMDAILRFYIRRDITPGSFFHVHFWAEILLLAIDIHSEVRMPVYLIRTRGEDVGDSDGEECKNTPKNMFFHIQ